MKSWKTWENVQICRVETPSIMWVKDVNRSAHPLYQDFRRLQDQLDKAFHKEIHKRYDNVQSLKKNQSAVVHHNDSWCRCIVLDIKIPNRYQKTVDVFLFDYGKHITVPASYICPLAAGTWCSIPYLCRRIKLINTAPAELCWRDEKGVQGLNFRAGLEWSASAIRFVKEIVQQPHTCNFQLSAPYVPSSNSTCIGHIYLEMTNEIRKVIYGFNYEEENEQLETCENLSDLLVACKLAVLVEEDLTPWLHQVKEDEKVGQTDENKEQPRINEESPIHKQIITTPIMENNFQPVCKSDVTGRKLFKTELSAMHNQSPQTLRSVPKVVNLSITSDLCDIPMSADPTLFKSFRGVFDDSSLSYCEKTKQSAVIQKETLTGYEKKVRSPLKSAQELLSPVKQTKMKSDVDNGSDDVSVDKNISKVTLSHGTNKYKSTLSNAYLNIRPMFDLAKTFRVYNCGSISVPRHELILDEPDSRQVINRSVCQVLKEWNGQFMVLPLQTFMWPTVVRGRSCVAVERRHEGKTLGYIIPLASQILDNIDTLRKYATCLNGPLAIIVCPEWSNVTEVTRYMKDLTTFTDIRVAAMYGGMSKSSNEEDKKSMFSVDVLVTTMPSLFRLGIFLQDDSVPGISLQRCSFLVFDNFGSIYSKFVDLTDCLIDKWLLTVRQCETVKQLVITNKQWNDDVEKVTEKISVLNPNILISSIFEAAVASLVKTRLDCCRNDVLVSQGVCDAICNYGGKKIIVFLDGPHHGERLEELLMTKAIGTIRVDSADIPVVKRATDLWANSRSGVMLIMEVVFIEYMSTSIKDADVIIHASIPQTSHHLGMRYSYMLDKFERVERGQATCISHFIITPQMISRKPQIIPELERLGVEIADQVKNAYDAGIRMQKEETLSKDLCFSFKSFGECPEPNCGWRHYITKRDEPNLPTDGQVKLEIIHVTSATCFLARIRCYRNKTGRSINLEPVYQRVHTLLQDYYTVKENRKCVKNVDVGSLCALESQSWVRAKIIKMDFSAHRVMYTVKMMDEHGLEQRSIDSLYELPDSIKNIPPLAIEVILTNIKPIDEATQFTQYAKHVVSSQLLEQNVIIYFTAMILFAIENTLFIKELVEIRTVANVPKETSYLARELLQCKLATQNPSHLQRFAVDYTNSSVKFDKGDDSWLKNYLILTKVHCPAPVDETMIDVGNETIKSESDSMSCVSSGSSTLVESPVNQTTSDSGTSKCSLKATSETSKSTSNMNSDSGTSKGTSKIDALKSRIRRSLPNKVTSPIAKQEKKNVSDVIPVSQLRALGPPPACYLSCNNDSSLDLDDVMSYSNFEVVTVDPEDPSEVSFSSSMFTSISANLILNEEVAVDVEQVFSANNFFVTKSSNYEMLQSMEDKIQANIKNLPSFDPDEDISGLYVARFTDGLYYRALLTDFQDGSCTVNFVDHGERMVISWDKIHKCPPVLFNIPFQAIPCELQGIDIPRKKFVAAKQLMETIVDSNSSWFIKPISAQETNNVFHYTVELFTKTEKESVNMTKSLVDAGLGELVTGPPTRKEINNEKQMLQTQRINRLINERMSLHSPTETIKDYLLNDNASVVSEVTNNVDDEANLTSNLSRPTSIASVLKRMRLTKTGTESPQVSRDRPNTTSSVNGSKISPANGKVVSNDTKISSPTQNPVTHNVRHPHTTWKDTDNMITLQFQLVGVEDYVFDASETCVHFSTKVNGENYTFSEKLFGNIISDTANCTVKGREVVVQVIKEFKSKWPRLLHEQGRIPWLKRDITILDDSSVCSSVVSNGSVKWKKPEKMKQYGGLPGGFSDDDSTMSECTISDADSELFKYG